MLLPLALGLAIGVATSSTSFPLIRRAVQLAVVAAIMGVLAAVTWRRPDIGVALLVVVLPVQQLLLGWLYRLGVSVQILSVTRFWKEFVIAILALRVLKERVGRRDLLDTLALLLVAITALYVVLPIGPPMYIRTVAARSEAAFLVLLIIVRHLGWPKESYDRLERTTSFMACVLAAFAVWNAFDPESFGRWIAGTGLHQYRRAVLGVFEQPVLFYSGDPFAPFLRAGSLFLSPNVLAFYTLIPIAMVLGRLVTGKARWWHLFVGATAMATVFLTLTRSAMAAIPLMVVLALAAGYSRGRVAMAMVATLVVVWPLTIALNVGPRIGSAFDPNEPSTQSHVERLRQSTELIAANPFGTGLGTSGAASRRFRVAGLTSESWYLQVGTELGVFPMVLYVLIVAAALRGLWVRSRDRDGPAIVGLCALAGIAAGGIVLPNLDEAAVAWPLWILVGLALGPALASTTDRARSEQLPAQ